MSKSTQEARFQKLTHFLLKHLQILARPIQNALMWQHQNLEWHQIISVWIYALIPFALPVMFTLAFGAGSKLAQGWIIAINVAASILISWLFGQTISIVKVSDNDHIE